MTALEKHFEQAAPRLFSQVMASRQRRQADWEALHGAVSEEAAAMLFETAIVCVDHQRFIPCRHCMYTQPAATAYSDDPDDVNAVRTAQQRNRPPSH